MKYLRVNFNRYQRKLSWKIRPLLDIDETDFMGATVTCCSLGLFIVILEMFT